jgi:hypothetical protein
MRFGNRIQLAALAALPLALLLPSALPAAGSKVLTNHVPAAVARATRVGPMPRNAQLSLAIGLPLRNQSELETLLKNVADPASPEYRSYLTPEEFTRRFGPTEADYSAVTAFAESHGLKVTGTHPNRMILDVTGPVSEIETAFNIEIATWSDSVRGTFHAPDREPTIDADLPILDIAGLDNYVIPKPMSIKSAPFAAAVADAANGSGPGGFLIGGDFRAAYAPGVKMTGAGQTIGLFELDGFYPSDVTANFAAAGLPVVSVQTVLLDGFNGSPGSGNIEVMLDIMMAAYMAPGAKIVVYEGTNWNDVLNRMATDDSASQISSSWGFSPINATTEQIFKQYIAQGQSLFQASGDDGAYRSGVMSPSDDPNLTVVGGTHLNTSGPGGSWSSETAWSGSGGGVSRTYAIPSYQQAVKMTAVGGSSTMRNIPDVALTADIQMFLIQNNGQAISVGGTSAAAPLWAGFTALANQQALSKGQSPLGFLNPALYTLGLGSSYLATLHDIVLGSDGFSTAPGYDLVTGWGSPAGQPLIDKLTGASSAPSFALSGSSASITITPGSTGTSTIAITPSGGFSGSVALTVSGLPTGVTASFSPASASASSILTLTASSTAVPGTSSLTVTGKSGAVTSTFNLGLTITSPSGFTLSASPSNIGLVQGNSAKSTLTLTDTGNFSGTVTLAVSGLPTGVTATLTRGATATTVALMLNASATAATGTYSVTVTGTSGSITETATIALTVSAIPTFNLSTSTAGVTVGAGSSGSATVSVSPLNGFNSVVTLAVSGLPAGVTAQLGSPSTSSSSTLTFSAGTSAAAGTSTVTVTGTSGTLIKTATIALTVASPSSYTLATSPASLTLTAGSTAGANVTVSALGGFSGKVSFAATGLPSGLTAAFSTAASATGSAITFTASATAAVGPATVTITGTSGSISKTAAIAITVQPQSDFGITFPQGGLIVMPGTSGVGVVSVNPVNGFTGAVALSATGLPAGVTASFSTVSPNLSTVTFAVAGTVAIGSAKVGITGTSGALTHTTTISLEFLPAPGGTTPVNLSSAYNIPGIAIDTVKFTTGGLDTDGNSYSGLMLGTLQQVAGYLYVFGPMNALSAVSGTTVKLPAGQYGQLKLLATAVNGNQTAQTFTVNYTDGTKSTFVQSLSDWALSQNYPGESTAITLPYRDTSAGGIDGRTYKLYGYSFTLTPGKTVSSIVLPNNRKVAVLAMTLTGAAASQTK